jgi:RNA polymerase sigma-70 factor (ECF subfamily)
LKTYKGGGRLATWLFTIARRQCLDYIRAGSRRKKVRIALTEPEMLDTGQPLSSREDPLEASEMEEAILRALDCLDERSRLLIVLFHFEGLSYEEISKVVGVPENSVSALLRKARESLGKFLEG